MLYKENPFYILDASLEDNRRTISRLAEEKAFLSDSPDISEARAILTNPQRRISAEVHWFPDCSREEVAEIKEYISYICSGKTDCNLPFNDYSSLTQLNVALACIDSEDYNQATKTRYSILKISRIFEEIDSYDVLNIINERREVSGFPPIQNINDIDDALSELQSEIRRALSKKLQPLSLTKYVEIITWISEDYSGHHRYQGQQVLEDAISEYRLFSNDLTKKKEDSILKIAGFIKQGAKSIKVDDAVSDLIKDLKEWDRLAQPLQLYEMAKGRIHTDSEQILNTLRDLSISLHNDHELTDEAIKITDALIEVFKELPEYSELLTDDKAALAKIKADNDITNAIISDLNCLEAVASEVSSSPESVRQTRIDTLLSTMKKLDGKIKANISDPALRNQLREKIAYLVRSVGISLHNEKHDSQSALSVISAARNEFADISDLYNKFSNDIITLNREISQKRALEEAQKKALEEKKKAKKRKIIVWIIIFIIGLYFYISSQNSSSKKPPSKSIYSSSSSLVAQTMPENGHVFYCSEKDRPSSFKVTNNGSSNYYMKFVKVGTKSAVIRFFVRAYSTAYINMPAGYYELRYAYGSTWYGEKELFGAYTKYAKDEDTYDFSSYEWEISLFTSNSTGNTMDVQSIDADEF